eukprot:scaffold9087_cov69-Phaeocystis_antarctica.AAC.4
MSQSWGCSAGASSPSINYPALGRHDQPQQGSRAARGMPGAPFGSTKSASSHTHHPTGHVAIMAMILSSPVNHRFAASSTARQQDRLTRRAHTR